MIELVDLTELSLADLLKVSHELDNYVFPDDSILRKYIPKDEPIAFHIIALNASVRIAMTKMLEKNL
jgi:hypothetical protein